MSLLAKLKKNSKIDSASVMSESKVFSNRAICTTDIPMLNVALSGDIDGGLGSGITTIGAPSRHFKSGISLVIASSFLKQHAEGVILFYDSEFGSPQQYFKNFGVDTERVMHIPITDIEQLKFDLMGQLATLSKEDKVMIIIDSVGNLASKKEVEDAVNMKSVADMTRAKALKGLFRMITPHLTLKDIPLIAIAHVYSTQEMYAKTIISGGTGILYSSTNAWIVGRQQNKEGTELLGYNFIINIEKSRAIKEKSKIPLTVLFDGGIEKYSGLLELALAGGFVIKPKQGWYQRVDPKTKLPLEDSFREKATYTPEFWDLYLNSNVFKEFVKTHYMIGYKSPIAGEFLSDVKIVTTEDEE